MNEKTSDKSRSTNGGVNTFYWRGEKQNTKVGLTTTLSSIHQLEFAFTHPLNVLVKHAINKTHEKDIHHPIHT